MKEGTAINKSLLNLGIVINQLAHKSSVVSYRDSKLTRILQRSLGGNAKTVILCNITPAACHLEESSNTLRFGCRAKKVVNTACVNEVISDAALLKRQAKEIEQLKKRLAESGCEANPYSTVCRISHFSRNPDIAFEISQMRAALLRSEHEKELMQIKLDEEKAKKEKAERQVQVATQLMFSQEQELMFLQDRAKRRDTWCPGEATQSSILRLKEQKDSFMSAAKEPGFSTPPSAKRHAKMGPSSSRCTTEPVETEASDMKRMSTEDVRQLVRDLIDEKTEVQRKLDAALEGTKQKTVHIESLEADLKAAYRAKRSLIPVTEMKDEGTERECDVLRVKLAAMRLRNRELLMETEISMMFLKKLILQQKQKKETALGESAAVPIVKTDSMGNAGGLCPRKHLPVDPSHEEQSSRTEVMGQEMQTELVSAQNQIEKLERAREILESSVVQLEIQNSSKKSKPLSQDTSKCQNAGFLDECDGLRVELRESEKGQEALKRHFEQEISALKSHYGGKTTETDRLKKELEKLTVVHSETLVQLESIKEQLNNTRRARDQQENAIHVRVTEVQEEAEFRVHEISVHKELLAAENRELRKCLDEKEDEYLQMKVEFESTKKEKEDIEVSGKEQKAQLRKHQQVNHLRARSRAYPCRTLIQQIEKELEITQLSLSHFEDKFTRKCQEEQRLTQEVSALERELQNMKNEMESLQQSANLQSAENEDQRVQEMHVTPSSVIQLHTEFCSDFAEKV